MSAGPEDDIRAAVEGAEVVELDLDELSEEVAGLADLSDLEYDQIREKTAKRLNIRRSTLDRAVAGLKTGNGSPLKGKPIELREFEEWAEPVDGADVLDEVRSHILRHMVIDEHQADAVALWAAHVHMFDDFPHTPRLLITAPDAECGKTLLMVHVVGNLVPKPLPTELMKPAPFFRLAEQVKPTFLIDEADVFIRQDSELLSAIHAGWEPQGVVIRCIGDDHEPRAFSTHTPVVMAGIELQKKLRQTTLSRSVLVKLERAAEGEIDENDIFDSRKHTSGILQTGQKLARWVSDYRRRISESDPSLPPGVRNRLADKWLPLLAIADAAGGRWPERARAAIFTQPDVSAPTVGLRLLADIRKVLKCKARNVASVDLLQMLVDLEDAPWSSYRDRGLRPKDLAENLARYGVKPRTVRLSGELNTAKGYAKKDLEMAWSRYIALATSDEESQSHSYVESMTYPASKRNGVLPAVTDAYALQSSSDAGCDLVTPIRRDPRTGAVRNVGGRRYLDIAGETC